MSGQALTSGQGSVTQSADVALTGTALASSIGTIVGTPGAVISGADVTSATGTAPSLYFVPLKSRKVGSGSATFGLTGIVLSGSPGLPAPSMTRNDVVGSAFTTATGSLGKSKSVALSGTAATGVTGTMSASGPGITILTVPSEIFTDTLGNQSIDLAALYVQGWNPAIHTMTQTAGTPALPTGVTLGTNGLLSFNDATGTVGSSSGFQFDVNYSADGDFAARSSAGGVVMSNNFATLVISGDTKVDGYSRSGGGTTPNHMAGDTAIRCSGTQSLRLNMADPQADSAGQYLLFYGSSTFGEGSTFYVQYRWRCSAEFLLNNNGGGKKISVLHYLDSSCADVECTVINQFNSNTFKLYTHCGADHPNAVAAPAISANTWYTIDQRLTIGNWGSANSYIQAWITPVGSSTRTQFIEAPNFTIFNAPPVFPGFNRITLTPYDTGATTAPGGFVWYDEVIVSTSPIALPSALPIGG